MAIERSEKLKLGEGGAPATVAVWAQKTFTPLLTRPQGSPKKVRLITVIAPLPVWYYEKWVGRHTVGQIRQKCKETSNFM